MHFLLRIAVLLLIWAIGDGHSTLYAESRVAEAASWPKDVRRDMTTVSAIDWRLSRQASRYCVDLVVDVGMRLDDLGAYSERSQERVAAELLLGPKPQIVALDPLGIAEAAGLEQGDVIEAINGKPVLAFSHGIRGTTISERVERGMMLLPRNKELEIRAVRSGEVQHYRLLPSEKCDYLPTLIVDEHLRAFSDTTGLAVSTGMVRFAETDDELAIILGHELAHIIMKSHGSRLRNKNKEDFADWLGVYLASCAGYDAERGIRFWRRYKKRPFDFLSVSHRSNSARYKRLEARLKKEICSEIHAQEIYQMLHSNRLTKLHEK